MATHTIHISTNDGNFVYNPAAQHASPSDKIRWLSPDGAFTVTFIGGTPFNVVSISGNKGVATPPKAFRPGVLPGIYHYAVAVAVVVDPLALPEGGIRVHVDAGCPEIVIP